MKLEKFLLSQLYILGAVGIGIAFLQVKAFTAEQNRDKYEHLF